MLCAVAWIDGELRPSEAHLILEAARSEGYDADTLAKLQGGIEEPVDFGEVDQAALTADARLYVYAMSSWIARTDGRVSADEQAALHAVATLIGVTGRGREAMDDLVSGLDTSASFSQATLRKAIAERIAQLAT